MPDVRIAFDAHRADLAARFDAARARGDTLHQREEARFELEIRGDAKKALALARDNWEVQREPADLRILGQAALAADDAAALQAFNSWIDDTRLQDATLVAVRGAKR